MHVMICCPNVKMNTIHIVIIHIPYNRFYLGILAKKATQRHIHSCQKQNLPFKIASLLSFFTILNQFLSNFADFSRVFRPCYIDPGSTITAVDDNGERRGSDCVAFPKSACCGNE